MIRSRALRALVAALAMIAIACGDESAWSDAKDMERKLLMANPQATYADPGYLRVAQRLTEVPRTSADRARADELLGQIQDARRLQLGEAWGLDAPARLASVDPASLRPVTEGVARVEPRAAARPAEPAPNAAPAPEAAPAPVATDALAVAPAGDQKAQVILYGTSWCGYCKKARSYFDRNGIAYVDKDVEADPAAARELRAKVGGYSGVPVIDVGGTVIRGYDLPSIKRALASLPR